MKYDIGQVVIIKGDKWYDWLKNRKDKGYSQQPNIDPAIAVIHGIDDNNYLCLFGTFQNGVRTGWQDNMIVSEDDIIGTLLYGTKVCLNYDFGTIYNTDAMYISKSTFLLSNGDIFDTRDYVKPDNTKFIDIRILDNNNHSYNINDDELINDIYYSLGE